MATPIDMISCPLEVSSEDAWGDPACLAAERPAVLLPPKRLREDSSIAGDGSFRIGARVSNDPAPKPTTRLEVRKIDGKVVRLLPEEPEIPRMLPKVVFHEKPDRANHIAQMEEPQEWGRPKKQPILWVLGNGVAIAALVVGAILALPLVNKPNAARAGSGEAKWVLETVADGQSMADMLSRMAEAGGVFRSFLAEPSAEAALPLVRNPEEVAELIRADRRMPKLAADVAPLQIDSWVACENRSLTYGILSGTLPDYSQCETYFTLRDGRLVMDWKASTAYGTADFTQLMHKQGNPAEIRGWIEATGFYSLAFPENSYQAFILASPDKQQLIWAYARRSSPVEQELTALTQGGAILKGSQEAQKATVRLAPGPGDALPGQWEIVELLHKEWIAP